MHFTSFCFIIIALVMANLAAPTPFLKQKSKDSLEYFDSAKEVTSSRKVQNDSPMDVIGQNKSEWIGILRNKVNISRAQNRGIVLGKGDKKQGFVRKLPRFEYSHQSNTIDPCPTLEKTEKIYKAFRSSSGNHTISILPIVAKRRMCVSSVPITTVNDGKSYCATVRIRHPVYTTTRRVIHGHFEHECKLFVKTRGLMIQKQVGANENEDTSRPLLGNLTCTSDIIVISSLVFSALCLLSCFYRNRPQRLQQT